MRGAGCKGILAPRMHGSERGTDYSEKCASTAIRATLCETAPAVSGWRKRRSQIFVSAVRRRQKCLIRRSSDVPADQHSTLLGDVCSSPSFPLCSFVHGDGNEMAKSFSRASAFVRILRFHAACLLVQHARLEDCTATVICTSLPRSSGDAICFAALLAALQTHEQMNTLALSNQASAH